MATGALWPFEGPAADELGPASGFESSETDKAESLSLSVSLIAVRSEWTSEEDTETVAESVGINARSMDARELEGDVVRLSTRCLLRARTSSGSASSEGGVEVEERKPEEEG